MQDEIQETDCHCQKKSTKLWNTGHSIFSLKRWKTSSEKNAKALHPSVILVWYFLWKSITDFLKVLMFRTKVKVSFISACVTCKGLKLCFSLCHALTETGETFYCKTGCVGYAYVTISVTNDNNLNCNIYE